MEINVTFAYYSTVTVLLHNEQVDTFVHVHQKEWQSSFFCRRLFTKVVILHRFHFTNANFVDFLHKKPWKNNKWFYKSETVKKVTMTFTF